MPKYIVSEDLIVAARRAKEWHETKGMKVAKPPDVPHMVASWILGHCLATEDAADTTAPVAPAALAEGWGWPALSRKAHYFLAGDSTSLCRKWAFTGERIQAPVLDEPGPDDCTTCSRMLARRTKAAQTPVEP